MAKFSALAIMLQSSRKSSKDKDGSADTKESKDIKVRAGMMIGRGNIDGLDRLCLLRLRSRQ